MSGSCNAAFVTTFSWPNLRAISDKKIPIQQAQLVYQKHISIDVFVIKVIINFSIVATFYIIQNKFNNRVVLKMLKKLVIAMTNTLICYMIVEVCYTNLCLISKLIILGIKFKISSRKTSFANYNIVKLKREIRLNQCIPTQTKN